MLHAQQRKEKNCLNCGTEVIGPFCHICGQPNTEPKETVWQLINHFFADITHFDGKIFDSLRLVILKPGFLSRQYMHGKRMSYLNPVRMYLFVSAIFFLIFFSIIKIDETNVSTGVTHEEIDNMDSIKFEKLGKIINNGNSISKEEYKKRFPNNGFHVAPGSYNTKKEYDSILNAGIKKHNWIEKLLVYKNIELNEKYHHNSKQILSAIINKLLHTIPQMLFLLLPLFALELKLLYIRTKKFYFVDHAIFTLHFYIFIFIEMLMIFVIEKIKDWLDWKWLNYVVGLLTLSIFFYLYKALRNFYQQGRIKTIGKFLLLLVIFLITAVFLFIVFFFLSLFGI